MFERYDVLNRIGLAPQQLRKAWLLKMQSENF